MREVFKQRKGQLRDGTHILASRDKRKREGQQTAKETNKGLGSTHILMRRKISRQLKLKDKQGQNLQADEQRQHQRKKDHQAAHKMNKEWHSHPNKQRQSISRQ